MKKLKTNTGDLYGKYSHPVGIKYTKQNISIRKKTLSKILLYFNKKKRKNLKVLEIGGTGQAASAWSSLGLDTTFIELSKININTTRQFAKKNKIKIKLINKDIFQTNLKKNYYDIIRSRGVIHHLKYPEKIFKKVNQSLKINGIFHFNIYRSGVFFHFFQQLLRNISKNIDIDLFIKVLNKIKISSKIQRLFSNPTIKTHNVFKAQILDDLFVPIYNPGNQNEILKDLKKLNFEIMHKNNIKKDLDHNIRYPDFPEKKQIIEFDAKKIKNCSIKINSNYKIKKLQTKKISNLSYAKLTLEYFKKLEKIIDNKKLYNSKLLIQEIIKMYKNCYLLSVKKITGKQRHIKFQKNLKEIIKKIS